MKVNPELISSYLELPSNKKLYFASDFHLGIPGKTESDLREQKIINWLQHVSKDAAAIFLVGDLFDFWFEYKTVIPRGHIRFQGKLAELVDREIPVHVFLGNHDLWLKEYLAEEIGVKIHKDLVKLNVNDKSFLIGHGDGLGPGDLSFKIKKSIFVNPFFQWLFRWIHPDIGVRFAKYLSTRSRSKGSDEPFESKEKEALWQFASEINQKSAYDYYVFGDRHVPLQIQVDDNSTYFNLGEWISQCNYLEFDGSNATLKTFEG